MPLLPILAALLSLAAAAEPVPAPPGPDGAPMVLVPAGQFLRGSRTGEPNERPARTVSLDAFAVDQLEVTVARFTAFVEATGHRTIAEREGWAWVWVGEWGKGGKFVRTAGADWRRPKVPGSAPLPEHPVTQVSHPDAETYCRWAGKRLLTEAE
ncbi:MAG: formylglycine-generating enzyme family protein, partial [candidate division NC10 bacterium]|nr:formylglycine-generating enzyme family protein [candidate division NC10 bacterium]